MNLATIKTRLEAIPALARKVRIAATWEQAAERTTGDVEAWITNVSGTTADSMTIPGVWQESTISFTILLQIRDVGDPTGAKQAAEMDTLRALVIDALLGKVPQTGYTPILHRRDGVMGFADGRLYWADVFETSYVMRAEIE